MKEITFLSYFFLIGANFDYYNYLDVSGNVLFEIIN
jgi:hypothetical protein